MFAMKVNIFYSSLKNSPKSGIFVRSSDGTVAIHCRIPMESLQQNFDVVACCRWGDPECNRKSEKVKLRDDIDSTLADDKPSVIQNAHAFANHLHFRLRMRDVYVL